ncbi:MAG: phosphoenolpyruvate hydrolase family protein [Candidatus Asgardarchaeia archaeon]
MVDYIPREEILANFREKIKRGEPIIGAGAGTGISAKNEELGGVDLIIIYNSGKYRMAGRGSLLGLLPVGDAHEVLLELAKEVLTVVKKTPVLAGVFGGHPWTNFRRFIKYLKELGFSGVQNFPTMGLIDKDSRFRRNLEETGMGYKEEIKMIKIAHEENMLTTPYVFDEEDAKAMAEAGADIIVAHMGLTAKGTIGAKTTVTLEEAVERIKAIMEAAREVNPDIIFLCHGGPIADLEDWKYIAKHVPRIHGFYGASTFERLPTEKAIQEQARRFKEIKLK